MNIPLRVGISPTLNIRGLIADQDIKKNQIIERCPVILVDKRDLKVLTQTVMSRYYYEWTARHSCVVLGYGSLYNHSFAPNVRYAFNYKAQLLVFSASRHIAAGEELSVNYLFESTSEAELEGRYIDFDPHRKPAQ